MNASAPPSHQHSQQHDCEKQPLLPAHDVPRSLRHDAPKRFRRFCRFSVIALALFFLFNQHAVSRGVRSLFHPAPPPHGGPHRRPHHGSGDRHHGHGPEMGEMFVQRGHFDLDAAHEGTLFVRSHGPHHGGHIHLHVAEGASDTISVDYEARSSHEGLIEQVLRADKRSEGDREGVVIESHPQSRGGHHASIHVDVNVTFPAGSDGARELPAFDLETDLGSLRGDDLAASLLFDAFTARAPVGSMDFESIAAKGTVHLRSDVGSLRAPGRIEGDEVRIVSDAGAIVLGEVVARRSATIETGVGKIDVDTIRAPTVRAHANAGSVTARSVEAAQARLTSDLGAVHATVTPVARAAADAARADEPADVEARSSKGRVELALSDKPSKEGKAAFASRAHVVARSDLGSAQLTAWDGFLGHFELRTQLGSVHYGLADADADGGSKREIEAETSNRWPAKGAQGCVFEKGSSADKQCGDGGSAAAYSLRASSEMGSVQAAL